MDLEMEMLSYRNTKRQAVAVGKEARFFPVVFVVQMHKSVQMVQMADKQKCCRSEISGKGDWLGRPKWSKVKPWDRRTNMNS